MATFQTYQAKGVREDLTDVITNITPMETWFTSTIGNTPVKGTYHEWQTDVLADAAENAAVEGAASSDGTITPTVRAGNYTQILTKCFKIAKTEEAVDKAGRKSEIAYQTEKHMKELAKDLEYCLLLNSAANSGASGTARLSKGALGFIVTNTGSASASTVDITEAALIDNLQTMWAAGAKPAHVVCGGYQKRKISGFTTNTRYMVADENKLSSAVDVFQSDFGTVTIRLHYLLNATGFADRIMIFGDMGLWKKGFLRGVKRTQEPFAGDADLFSLRTEVTLESRQEKGAGMLLGYKKA